MQLFNPIHKAELISIVEEASAKAAKNAAMEAAAGGELKKEDASGQNRSMSIAERANMVKNLEDEEEDGENEKE